MVLPVTPTATLIPAGQDAMAISPGDLIFLHRPGPVRDIIRAGQWVRSGLRPWAALTHVACVRDANGMLIEAVYPRVRRRHITEYHPQEYVHASTGLSQPDQGEAVAYLDSCVGERYGVLTCAGIAVRMFTPGHGGLVLMGSRTGICSGLAAEMLERGSYRFDHVAASMCPAELARAVGVQP